MNSELEELRALLLVSDLSQYADNDILLNYAFSYAVSEINHRRGRKETIPLYEPQYRTNAIQGAIDWLSRIGAEEYASTSENGVSVTFKTTPSWLASVTPRLGVPS